MDSPGHMAKYGFLQLDGFRNQYDFGHTADSGYPTILLLIFFSQQKI